MTTINGVPYPSAVCDEESLAAWIRSIDRPIKHSVRRFVKYIYDGRFFTIDHKGLGPVSIFYEDNSDSKRIATLLVTRSMANNLFHDLIMRPGSALIWRIEPEFDIGHLAIPASKPIPKHMMEGLLPNDWEMDFVTDRVFPMACQKGEWRLFRGYMRYSVADMDGTVVEEEANG
jgi:hypothetical protein